MRRSARAARSEFDISGEEPPPLDDDAPPPLEEVVRLYTKAAIRAQPAGDQELLEWSAKWFAEKAAELAKG